MALGFDGDWDSQLQAQNADFNTRMGDAFFSLPTGLVNRSRYAPFPDFSDTSPDQLASHDVSYAASDLGRLRAENAKLRELLRVNESTMAALSPVPSRDSIPSVASSVPFGRIRSPLAPTPTLPSSLSPIRNKSSRTASPSIKRNAAESRLSKGRLTPDSRIRPHRMGTAPKSSWHSTGLLRLQANDSVSDGLTSE